MKLISYLYSYIFTSLFLMREISLFHKNRKLRQRRIKFVPLQICAYYISSPFSQTLLLTFSIIYIYKKINLFVSSMATQTADSWGYNALNIALTLDVSILSLRQSLWSPVHLSVLSQFILNNFPLITTSRYITSKWQHLWPCTCFQEYIKQFCLVEAY